MDDEILLNQTISPLISSDMPENCCYLLLIVPKFRAHRAVIREIIAQKELKLASNRPKIAENRGFSRISARL